MAVLDALRADARTADMPVVFVTGHTDARDLAEGLERGAHDYVRKPVDPVELVARIRTALRLRALHDELARRNAELEQLARTDVLTGLANRRHADDVLRATIASARRHDRALCAVLVDIDRFKAVNDAHGHAAGDAVLREVAVRLAAGLREEDLAARWGGEEFLLLLPDSPDAGVVCERLRSAIAGPPDQRPRRAGVARLAPLRLGAVDRRGDRRGARRPRRRRALRRQGRRARPRGAAADLPAAPPLADAA